MNTPLAALVARRPAPAVAALLALAIQIAVQPASAQPIHAPPVANPANCRSTGTFEAWMDAFKAEALKSGIKPATIAAALGTVTFDPSIVARDRRQGFFSLSFLEFSDKLATRNRVDNGRRQIARHKALFESVEKEYGVPAEVITGLWALESDFGAAMGMGNLPVLRSLATLAYDCRRGHYFRGQLLDALRIIERGDLRPEEMVGSWAGELGQTQFLPTYYYHYAVDFDRDGRRDLYRSVPDVVATSANFMKGLGWKAGRPYLEEVRVPASLPWEQADLALKQPRSKWAALGVTRADGKPLANDSEPASLLLLMGRNGPAFLAYENFEVYTRWNQSLNYATTAAYLATRIAGAPLMSRGNAPVTVLAAPQVKELQQLLQRAGYIVGEPDGKLGTATRTAIRSAQVKLGLPADSYPSLELLARLGGRRAQAPATPASTAAPAAAPQASGRVRGQPQPPQAQPK